MKLIITALVALFSFNVLAAGTCGLSFWNTKIEAVNDSYARGEIDHQAYFSQTRNLQKMIAINAYECISEGKTSDLSKESIELAKKQFEIDKVRHIETAQKKIEVDLKYGSPYSAVESKMELEKLTEKYNKIQATINSL